MHALVLGYLDKKTKKVTIGGDSAKMIRSHGLTRALPKNSENRNSIELEYAHIDPEFLFSKIMTN